MPIKVVCEVCGKQFDKSPSRISPTGKNYCSQECYHKLAPWNKGGEMSEEFSLALSMLHKGRVPWNKGLKRWSAGEKNGNYGRKHSPETRRRMSENRRGKGGLQGPAHPNWNGGRRRKKYSGNWKAVRRDKIEEHPYCCICGRFTEHLHVHHKDGDSLNNEPENLVVICRSCHPTVEHRGEETAWLIKAFTS